MSSFSVKLKSLTAHPLISGTLILTGAGLLSRLIGFFYRIYLSRLFGEENMGIYQLISPVISLAFSICAGSYQTAISKMTSEFAVHAPSQKSPLTKRPFWAALLIVLPLSLLCTAVTFLFASPIGTYLLKEERTIPLLRIISFSFPFVGIHACINGWFYGMKKAGLPAAAQLIEQLTRVGCVYFVTTYTLTSRQTPNISIAVFGLALGELVSMLVAVFTYLPFFSESSRAASSPFHPSFSHLPAFSKSSIPLPADYPHIFHNLLALVIPLTANRLILTLLGSAESVAIPERLRLYGYNTETALSVFGVLTGMAMPLIFFPNALTGSIAVMLLPEISENYSLKKYDAVRKLTMQTMKYCFLMGLCCMLVFVTFGPFIGSFLFHSSFAGECIRTLGFICPFLYLDTTLSGILQGLGKAGSIFWINTASTLVRLLFVYLAVPILGIKGYLWGLLAGQLLLCFFSLLCLRKFFCRHC